MLSASLYKKFVYSSSVNVMCLQINWSNDMIARMNSGDLAKDVTEAENHLQMHHERKVRPGNTNGVLLCNWHLD